MSQTRVSKFQKEPDHETITSRTTEPPTTAKKVEDDMATAQIEDLTPKEQQAIKVLGEALNGQMKRPRKAYNAVSTMKASLSRRQNNT